MARFQLRDDTEPMIQVEDAQQRVLDLVSPLGSERVGLMESLGRVLREDIEAPRDVPQADNSAMDGYAVQCADIAQASTASPQVLKVLEEIPAGSVASNRVGPGTAIRIMTGAPVPGGADAVVPAELTDGGEETVLVYGAVRRGANIRRRAEDMRAGDLVLPEGIVLGPGEIGVLASAQKSMVVVSRRPSVAILSTGDELVPIDGVPGPGQVVNSNSWSLAALAQESGASVRMCGIARDTRAATIEAIDSALDCDFVVSSGGVSVGAHDHVKEALDAVGAQTHFWQVAMKPGRPVVLATARGKIYFGLPGNPVSCMVSFLLFIRPALQKAMGVKGPLLPPAVVMPVSAPLRSRGDRRNFLRVRVTASAGVLTAHPMTAQGSGVSTSMIAANGLAVVEEGIREVPAGSSVQVILFGPVLAAG